MPSQSSSIPVGDALVLQVQNLVIPVMTGIYSRELNKPQPLRFSVRAWLEPSAHYGEDTPLSESKNYMDLKSVVERVCPTDRHLLLIESVADEIISALMAEDARVRAVEVNIVKLAISTQGEEIGITLHRTRK